MNADPVDPSTHLPDRSPTDATRNQLDTPQELIDAAHADAAERRLRSALREIKGRTETVVEDVRALAFPARVAGVALIAGLGAVAIVSFARRNRRRRPRSIANVVGRSILKELALRMALGAAGVIGARLASDLLLAGLPPSATTPRRRVKRRDD